MLVIPNRFLLFDDLQVWWPTSPDEVFRLLRKCSLVTVNQCSDQVAAALKSYAFRSKAFNTLLIDLTQSEEALWSRLSKSTRALIRRVGAFGCSVSVNEDVEGAFEFINDFIRERNYRRPIPVREWRRHLEHGDVFTAKHQGRIVAAHLVLVDGPRRARVVFGARTSRAGHVHRNLFGGVERYLHWYELKHYRAVGTPWFDLGGIELDPKSPLYSITRFKLSFGGDVARENIVRLTAYRSLRLALRGVARAKQVGAKMSKSFNPGALLSLGFGASSLEPTL